MNRLDIVKEQIRERVLITDLIERLTGQRFSKGKILCPLHNEKTPSFCADDKKGVYYCQGCGAGGDIFKFVQQYQNVLFEDAVRFIDSQFGLGLLDGKISVAAQIAVREARKKRALEEKVAKAANTRYDRLSAIYFINKTLLKTLEPMSDAWGQCIWRIEWLEYAMEEEMSALK